MPWPAMSGADPWTGSKSDGLTPVGVDVGRRGDPDAAHQRGRQVGQQVAEQVAADDDVETARVADQAGQQGVQVHRSTATSG